MIRRRRKEDDEDLDAWLITFADMVTLLLCFFVILFSLSSPDMTQFKKVAEALREHGFYNDAVVSEDPYEKLKLQLDMSLGASGYDSDVAVSKTPGAIEVELSSSSFFRPGQAKFTRRALPMLKVVAERILPMKDGNIVIDVEGHTDDTAIRTTEFPSNWELSSARASNVVRYLVAQGFPKYKLRAVGLADSLPKAPNRDSAGNPIPANQNLNRRVVIKIKRVED